MPQDSRAAIFQNGTSTSTGNRIARAAVAVRQCGRLQSRCAASACPVRAMADPLPVRQQYRDVREDQAPGEGIALAGSVNGKALKPARGADAIERDAECAPGLQDADRTTRACGKTGNQLCRSEPPRASRRIGVQVRPQQPASLREAHYRSLARLILTFQTVKSTNPARCPMTSTVRP